MKNLTLLFVILLVLQYVSAFSQPVIGRIYRPPQETGLYEKLELSLNITAVFSNPFDPGELDITGTFRAPSGKVWKVPGFYNQAQRGGFLVRFSPDETGEWSFIISVTDRNGTATSESASISHLSRHGARGWEDMTS